MDRFSMLICRIGAAGAVVIGGLGLATLIFGGGSERYATALLFGIAAAASWLAGRAARFLVMRK
jgi:hypothetical protein